MCEKPKPKRRWFRFSLRTLLIVVVLLSLPLGWFALKMREAERQRRAVEAIEKAGGEVWFECCIDESGKPQPQVPTWLSGLVGVDLFVDVVRVSIYEPEVSDVVLEHLKGLTNLKYLRLSNTQFSDAGLEHLKGVTNLESLELSCSQFSDAGLEHLKGLTNLKHLELAYTQVTDQGLEHLKGLIHLLWLDLSGTQVTEEGIEELCKALPNCQIYDDYHRKSQKDQTGS